MKLLAVFILALYGLISGIFLAISDAGYIAISSIAASFFSLVGLVVVALINRKVNTVKKSIDGLLKEKTKADLALGVIKGQEDAAKEEGIANKREVQIRREQDLLNMPPPNSGSSTTSDTVSDVKESIETEIKKQGVKIQEIVENKADEIKTEVPPLTADKVVEKINPPPKP